MEETFRRTAALQILCALLETTKHNIVLDKVIKTEYAKIAIEYADALIKQLGKSPKAPLESLKERYERMAKKGLFGGKSLGETIEFKDE